MGNLYCRQTRTKVRKCCALWLCQISFDNVIADVTQTTLRNTQHFDHRSVLIKTPATWRELGCVAVDSQYTLQYRTGEVHTTAQ